jgi:WD40 repeat protein/uncharacterized caspase-like protein
MKLSKSSSLLCAIQLLSIFVCSADSSRAQVPTPTPSEQRGIGIQSSGQTSSSNTSAQAKEAKPELVLQTGYNNFFGATKVVFSPDGRLLATGTFRSNTIKLWETSTGRELRNLAGGRQSGMALSPAIAFSNDSRLVAASVGGNAVKVWEVATGREMQTLSGAEGVVAGFGGVYFIAFGSNNQLVTISDAIRIWDVATGRELRTITGDTLTAMAGLAGEGGATLSLDGSQLARVVTDSDKLVKVYDLATGRETFSAKLPDQDIKTIDLGFTADGHLLVSGVVDKRVKLWDLTSKTGERDLGSAAQEWSILKFSRGSRFLAFSEGYTIKLWDVAAARELPSLKAPSGGFVNAANRVFANFSEDGKRVATGGFDTPTILWETESGKQLLQMKGRTNMAYQVAFSADGTQLSSGGRTRWDLRTGRGLRLAALPSEPQLGFPSPDGKLLAYYSPSASTVTIVETPSGRKLQTLAPSGQSVVQRVSFSADGSLLAVSYMANPEQMQKGVLPGGPGSNESPVRIWEVKSGRELTSIPAGTSTTAASFNANGRMLATLGSMGESSIWDIPSGGKLRDLTASPMAALTQMMQGAGRMNPTQLGKMKPGSMPQMPDLNAITGMMTNIMGSMSAGTMGRTVTSVSFSPDGGTLAIGGVESKSNLDFAAMMKNAQRPSKNKSKQPDAQDLMRDMKVEAIGQVTLWDVGTGTQTGVLSGHGKGVTQVVFSRDGRLLASGSSDNSIKIWDVASRRELKTLLGHTANIESIDFSPDARLLASASDDGATFLWDANTGEHLLTLISLDDGGEWMVVTPQGLFDGTPNSWNQILWRYNQDTFNVAPIEWFFNEYYYPGLLSEIFAGKRPKVAEDISRKDRRQPVVKLSLPEQPGSGAAELTSRTIKVKIDVTDAGVDKDNPQSAGARDLRLFRNGSLIKVWHGDVLNGKPAVALEEEISLVAGKNQLTAYVFNRDNVKSKDASLLLTGADALKRAGSVYIIAVGVNEYANPQYNLKYAVADAQSFAEEVKRRQTQIGQFERVEVVPLLNENATKANILSALQLLAGIPAPPSLKATDASFSGLKKAQPEDKVIIYFAGHGTAQAQRFYLIPHDLGYTGERTKLTEQGLQKILVSSISDLELEQAVEGLDAGHLLLIIDACNSGQALEAEEKRRGPMNSKGLAQLAYEKGMYILTAAQSYQAALEAAQLGHGLLTYALVEEGLKTAVADTEPQDGLLNAREWLSFATERVPQMQEAKMKQSRGVGLEIAFTEGEEKVAEPEKRTVQRPRVFYRRELEANPLLIAKP